MVERPLGTTGTGLHPRSITRRTVTRGGASGGTRGHPSEYDDQSHQWEDHKASGPAKENEGVPEAVVVADVEVEDNRDKHLGRTTADGVTHTASAHSASSAAAATEKEATRTRLGELHRLLKNRKGSLSATYKKNAEANDRANDMNKRTIQASQPGVDHQGISCLLELDRRVRLICLSVQMS